MGLLDGAANLLEPLSQPILVDGAPKNFVDRLAIRSSMTMYRRPSFVRPKSYNLSVLGVWPGYDLSLGLKAPYDFFLAC